MPISTFFIQKYCDRCNRMLGKKRNLSFFTKETLCEECSETEARVKQMIQEKFERQASGKKAG